MTIYGFESIAPLLRQEGYLVKLLANDKGVVVFPHTTEHRDATQPGIGVGHIHPLYFIDSSD